MVLTSFPPCGRFAEDCNALSNSSYSLPRTMNQQVTATAATANATAAATSRASRERSGRDRNRRSTAHSAPPDRRT